MALRETQGRKCFHRLDLLRSRLDAIGQSDGGPLRQVAHGAGLPHKQVLAVVSLRHELGEAHAHMWAALEQDGGRDHPGLIAAALRHRRYDHFQGSPWRTERVTAHEDDTSP